MEEWESKKKYEKENVCGMNLNPKNENTPKQQQDKASQNNAKQNNQLINIKRNTPAPIARTQEKL
jgi:hypothetical protein